MPGTWKILDVLLYPFAISKTKNAVAARDISLQGITLDLVESLKQLRFLVEDLQRNPERYLTVKIF